MTKKKSSDEGLPYFKFFISKWSTGNIQQCSHASQGLFINLCVLYWGQRGELYLSKMQKRFPRKQKQFAELVSEDVIKIIEDEIEISFLDEQLQELGYVSERNRNNAFKRWNPTKEDATASDSQCDGNANAMPIEEKRKEEKREEEKRRESADATGDVARETIPFENETLKAWNEWEQYRKDKKQKLTPLTIKKQIQFLGGRGDPEIIAIINQSITNGWTGLFELRKQNNGSKRQQNINSLVEGWSARHGNGTGTTG